MLTYREGHYVAPIVELSEEARLSLTLRRSGAKVNRARLTIRMRHAVSELTLEEREALETLKAKYHFLVLPQE